MLIPVTGTSKLMLISKLWTEYKSSFFLLSFDNCAPFTPPLVLSKGANMSSDFDELSWDFLSAAPAAAAVSFALVGIFTTLFITDLKWKREREREREIEIELILSQSVEFYYFWN